MFLCIDQGNTCVKAGIFDQQDIIGKKVFDRFGTAEVESLFRAYDIEACIYSTVSSRDEAAIALLQKKCAHFIEFSHTTPIPITNRYATPHTLGNDRLAGVIGAALLQPGKDVLVIDAGSAITYDFIDAQGNYWGGNISPGLDMRLRALHEFTHKLPLVKPQNEAPFFGDNTHDAILAGVIYGIVFEINGYIEQLKTEHPSLSTFLTGGSTFYFANKLKNAIFATENLILIGLNRILLYNNVQK